MTSRSNVRRRAATAVAAYLAIVFMVAFMLRLGDMRLPETVGGILGAFQGRGMLQGVRFGHVEAAANVLFFVPLGLLLPLAFAPRSPIAGWLCAVALSIGIEVVQHFLLDGRVGSVRDVICNALGAASGVLLTQAALLARARRTRGTIQSM